MYEPYRPPPRRLRAAAALLAAALLFGAAIAIRHQWQARGRPALLRIHPFPRGIVIHHTATAAWVRVAGRREPVTAAMVDSWHESRGFASVGPDGRAYHIGYHFLILPDGTVQHGRPETMFGAHAREHNDTLGVCLVGDFDRQDNPRGRRGPNTPSEAQIRSLEELLSQLLARYDLTPADIYLHREVVPTTRCPGDNFPAAEVLDAVRRRYYGSRRSGRTLGQTRTARNASAYPTPH